MWINDSVLSISLLIFPMGGRFFCQFLLLFALHQGSTSLCRFLASAFQTLITASTVGSLVLVGMYLFGGFIVPRRKLINNHFPHPTLSLKGKELHSLTEFTLFSLFTTMVEMGILGFSIDIWGDRDINKRVPCPTLAKGKLLIL